MDAALTVFNRLLRDEPCRDNVLAIEKLYPHKGPLDSVYKLEGIVKKCKVTSAIFWAIACIRDGLESGSLEPGQITFRELVCKGRPGNRGLLGEFALRQGLGNYLFFQAQSMAANPDMLAWLLNMQTHALYRETFGHKDSPKDITGMSVLSEAARNMVRFYAELVYSIKWSLTIKSASRQCKPPQDTLEVAPLAEPYTKIIEDIKNEKLGKPGNRGSTVVPLDAAPRTSNEEIDEMDDVSIANDPEGIIPQFHEFARCLIQENIKLVVDDASLSEKQLGLEIGQTTMGKMTGDAGSYVMVHFDAKQWAESDCRPHQRCPAANAEVIRRRVGAALRRHNPELQRQEIPPGDQYVLFDSGKDGLEHIMLSGFVNEATTKTTQKTKLKHTIIYTQASQVKRTGQRSMYHSTQQEGMLVVSRDMLAFDEKERKHFPVSTNWSSYLGPVAMAPVEDLWNMTVKEKLEAYGPFIAQAGGKTPGSESSQKFKERSDGDMEPICWYSSSLQLYDTLIGDSSPCAIIDLTATDGIMATAALRAKVSYLGICPTAFHASKLREHLEKVVFKEFQKYSEPLHEPSLVKVLKTGQSETSAVSQSAGEPKAMATKRKATGVDGSNNNEKPKPKAKTVPHKQKGIGESATGNDEDLKAQLIALGVNIPSDVDSNDECEEA